MKPFLVLVYHLKKVGLAPWYAIADWEAKVERNLEWQKHGLKKEVVIHFLPGNKMHLDTIVS